ncbi:antibiotic biosynthesis monooxygenase family protein [Nocardioides cynanchi]|uniref:antibiotic biosynthesis monooxygenase family protein n=1 Tax=Nocardioides cynanchi TaxID=2558918 RepID=UPI001243D4A2|nr:hypothetical protein [Nocardioides cynanchi]
MDLVTAAPPEEAIAAMAAIDGLNMVPITLNTQTGPERQLGPESAGAILILQGTFIDEERFAEFWMHVADLMQLLADAPGFIRRYNFAEGPHYTLIALWRSIEEAHGFFSRPEHQAAMRTSFERRWNYTHFAGLWEAASPRPRLFFCQTCEGVMPSPEPSCTGCGADLPDPFGGRDVRAAPVIS